MPRNLTGRQLLMSAKVTQDFAVFQDNDIGGNAMYSIYHIVFSVGSSAGAVVVEGGPDITYAGTWVNLGTATWSAAGKVHEIAIVGNFICRRIRISVAIVGGAGVDVYSVISG